MDLSRSLQIYAYLFMLCFSIVATMSYFPKLILISFDGFRYDLLNETMTPNIYKWAAHSTWFTNGSTSQYVTNTAPNHMSIVTGLHEVDHGIVANYFYDTTTGKFFDYFNLTSKPGVVNESLDTSWYSKEPIWLTNEKSSSLRRSASYYWPMADAPFPTPPHRPSMYKEWKTYGNLSDWMVDADEIVNSFLRESDPVNFVLWYIAEPDHTLHLNGFFNGELRKKVRQLDELFGYFIAKFHDTGLENSVNIILTADHGHAQIADVKKIMCVRDFISSEGYDIGDRMIYPHSDDIALKLYTNITNAVKTLGYKINVFLKEDVPARLFYSNSTRIGRIVLEPHIGWAASLSCTKEQLIRTYEAGKIRFNSSAHGMDPNHKEMRALLVVGGPAIVKGKKIPEVPNNIDLYLLMCHLLLIPATPNNGSMSVIGKALLKHRYHEQTGETSDLVVLGVLIMASSFIFLFLVIYIYQKISVGNHLIRSWSQKGYRLLQTDRSTNEEANTSDLAHLIKKGTNREEISDDEF